MKFNIAAKLGLLTAAVSLAATAIVGLWSVGQSRRVLTDRELVNLPDETELRVYELMNDFRYLRREGREVAPSTFRGEPNVKTSAWVADILAAQDNPTLALKEKAESSRDLLMGEFKKLLAKDENSYYLELCCVRIEKVPHPRAFHPLLAFGRRRAGEAPRALKTDPDAAPAEKLLTLETVKKSAELETLLASASSVRNPRNQTFPVRARLFPGAGFQEGVTPMLFTVAFPILFTGTKPTDMPPALLLMTIDFEEFIAFRSRFLPRHLLYLTDDSGKLLIHPNLERQQELRLASARNGGKLPAVVDEPALKEFAGHFNKKQSQQLQFRKERGAAIKEIALPSVAFSYAVQDLGSERHRAMMQEHWKELGDMLIGLTGKYPALHFSLPAKSSAELQISCPDEKDLQEVQKEVLAWQNKQNWDGPKWQAPVRCENFALRFMLLNPDLDARDTLRVLAKEPEETPRVFGLAMATGLEEIEHDINQATGWMFWVIAALGAGAALLAWGFSNWFTRPLKRIIRATEAIAEGGIESQTQAPLPVNAHDEIGVLARSFEKMRDQLRKRRDALYETIARMKAILDTAAEGIVVFDDHGEIESFNQAAEQIFGYKAQEIHGQKVNKLIATALPNAPAALGQVNLSDSVRIVAQVVRTRGEVEGRRKNGSTFPVEVAFSEVPLQGRKVVTGIFRDVTERKKAEEEIRRANEELESRVRLRTLELNEAMAKLEAALQGAMDATRAKDAFMASMSHELRTPLTTVIGYGEEFRDDFVDDEDSDRVNRIEILLGQARHLLALINDILDLSKIAAGKFELKLGEFDPAPMLRDLQASCKPLAAKYDNELIFEVTPGLGRMFADQTRVHQILLNLLSNACKFTDKGKITVRAWRETKPEGDEILFQVRDSGMGMTPEQVRRLGELFYQADQSNTRKKGGTGLGMAITKTFTNMMHGKFEVTSEPGKGTAFTVRLPARVELKESAKEAAPQPASLEASGFGRLPSEHRNLVLVVDDDPEVCGLLERFLVKEGMRVQIVTAGVQVLELARQLRPVAITLDVLMPGLDGWTLLAALKTDPTTADIPVIMLTIEDNPRRGFALGASDYLTKPIDWPRLAAVLHKYTEAAGSAPILVVEDNLENRELVCRMLQKEGRIPIPAENGRVALEKLNAGLRPALVLLDLMMPEMDGFAFLDELRKRRELAGVPVVVVTAKDLTEEDRRRLNGSVTQVLSKGSFTPDQLLDYLRGQVQQHTRSG